MTPSQWLEHNVPDFRDLKPQEREAIYAFAMLWSFFEFQMVKTEANPDSLKKLVAYWTEKGVLSMGPFAEHLAYFRERYFTKGKATAHFQNLVMDRKLPGSVIDVLKGQNTDTAEEVYACLMVTFRFRNNLFHGSKWYSGLRNEGTNFHHGSHVLMAALALP